MSRLSRKRRRHYSRVKGYIGWLKGKQTEERFYQAFYLEHFEKPRWLKKIRRGTPNEDKAGIDFVAETYARPEKIFIQIKSSEFGKKVFLRRHSRDEWEFPLIILVIDVWRFRYDAIRKEFFQTTSKLFADA
ncbi:hypothetical protein C4572_01575 [Candidatus Parcubacteria bacterium]|nr:MAG: hypothetical protein C4572_01575 [Candidatus Parcubacteria bacterium]